MNDRDARLRREADILERLDNVRRLIQMETTLTTSGQPWWCCYCKVDKEGKMVGRPFDDLLREVRAEIQLQLLSVTALCNGDNPDVGEPMPMLEWSSTARDAEHPEDKFRRVWEECLMWNA